MAWEQGAAKLDTVCSRSCVLDIVRSCSCVIFKSSIFDLTVLISSP